jgi:hypothetical protein
VVAVALETPILLAGLMLVAQVELTLVTVVVMAAQAAVALLKVPPSMAQVVVVALVDIAVMAALAGIKAYLRVFRVLLALEAAEAAERVVMTAPQFHLKAAAAVGVLACLVKVQAALEARRQTAQQVQII